MFFDYFLHFFTWTKVFYGIFGIGGGRDFIALIEMKYIR